MGRYTRSVPGTRYMSCRLGQLCVADVREILPGDFIKHRCRIGVHLSPLQAPEFSPLLIRQDTFIVENRILWDYWDNYISQKLLENSAVGPFAENELIPPQLYILMGAGNNLDEKTNFGHIANVRGVYDLLEQLGMRFSYTDSVPFSNQMRYTGTVNPLSAFPLMGYWRIWHCYYRDAFLQNDEFRAVGVSSSQDPTGLGLRIPLMGDPWADERPVPEEDILNGTNSWNAPMVLSPAFASYDSAVSHGKNMPGYILSWNGYAPSFESWRHPMMRTRGIFSFYKRNPACCVGITGGTVQESLILPGAAAVLPLDLGYKLGSDTTIRQAPGGLGFCATVNMPKDYVFTARQSPVYNADVLVPESVRDLRKAFQVLGYKEKVNRFDNRIKAWLWNMFHVNTSDKRLNEPLWLHGAQSIINTQEILGTVNNTDTVLGQLGGFGIGAVRGKMVKYRSEAHAFLYTLFYIAPTPVYGDGVRRAFFRGIVRPNGTPVNDGALDWPLPDFARVGQQSMHIGEVSFIGAQSSSDGEEMRCASYMPAGYVDRFSELDFSNADVCGDFRTTLRFWHAGLFYGAQDNVLSNSDDMARYRGVTGDNISLYLRNYNNLRGSVHTSQTISEMLSGRLFDAGNSADQFWCVVSTDYFVSSRVPSHPHPGYADHTSKVI